MKNPHGEEQDQQAVANTNESRVDIDDDVPYLSALKGLGRLCDKGPKLGELFVPSANGGFQCADYPVVINGVYLLVRVL